jgi:hypothetical protein
MNIRLVGAELSMLKHGRTDGRTDRKTLDEANNAPKNYSEVNYYEDVPMVI